MTSSEKVNSLFAKAKSVQLLYDMKIVMLIFDENEDVEEFASAFSSTTWELGVFVQNNLAYLFIDFANGGHCEICIGDKAEGWLNKLANEEACDIFILGGYLTSKGREPFQNWPTLKMRSKREFAFDQISTQDPSLGSVIQISGVDEKEFFPWGSGVLISEGLAVTARHVIVDLFKHLRPNDKSLQPDRKLEKTIDFKIIAIHNFGNEADPAIWEMTSAHYNEHSDIAVLRIKSLNDVAKKFTWSNFSKLKLTIPKPNDVIQAFGFVDLGKIKADNKGLTILNFISSNQFKLMSAVKTRGIVFDIHPQYRDKGTINFPCFRTDAKFEHAMSGGPVVDERNNIVGVVSIADQSPEGEWYSYSALIWPALAIDISESATNETLYDVLTQRNVEIIGKENLIKRENGRFDFKTSF